MCQHVKQTGPAIFRDPFVCYLLRFMSVCRGVCLSIYLFVYLSVCRGVCLFVMHPTLSEMLGDARDIKDVDLFVVVDIAELADIPIRTVAVLTEHVDDIGEFDQ